MQLISPDILKQWLQKQLFYENSSIYKKFIDVKYLITFDHDLVNFDKKLQQSIELSNDRNFVNLMHNM